MSNLELFLSLLGIALALFLSPPALRGIKRGMDAFERLRWSGAQYRNGILQDKRHIAFDEWACEFLIDDDGNCVQSYTVRLINLSEKLVSEFFLPIFCDTRPLFVENVQAWAKARGRPLTIIVDIWDEQRAEGRLKIKFPNSLAPGERFRFSYGITLPQLFKPGSDYYDWDIEVPHYDLKGTIRFSDVWTVKYARWGNKGVRHVASPTFEDRMVTWSASFPEPNTRLHLDLGLDRKDAGPTTKRLN